MAAENKRFVYPFQTKLNNENTDIRTAYTKRESFLSFQYSKRNKHSTINLTNKPQNFI